MISLLNIGLFNIIHQLGDFSRLWGMRDRCRCPNCEAVGTFKAHGGWLDSSRASGRRFLCKWCGYYKGRAFNRGPIAIKQARVVPSKGCWRLVEWDSEKEDIEDSYIPKERIEANPFRG